jgi:hypothetical protein
MGYLYNQSNDQQYNLAKTQAGYFLTVNDAVGKYMQNYFTELSAIPATCAKVALSEGAVPAPLTATCNFTSVSVSSPANALQPTLAELKTLGLLDANFQDGFLWSTDNTVLSPQLCTGSNCGSNANTAKSSYAVQIQKWCNGQLLTDDATTCDAVQLKSLTFNAQPFTNEVGFFKLSRHEKLSTAINSMGGDGLMSLDPTLDPTGKGQLFGVGNITFQDNPILKPNPSGNPGNGIPGILAVQNAAEIRCSAQ